MNYMVYPVKRQIIVNTRSDKTFRGILWSKRFGYLVLKNAELLKAGGETVALDGELVIFKDNVDFLQIL